MTKIVVFCCLVAVVVGLAWFWLRQRRVRPLPPIPRERDEPAPGHIWWADIPFDDKAEVKDRPCLVLGVDSRGVRVLKITSQDKSARGDEYVRLRSPEWSRKPGDSWLERRHVRTIPRSAMRRPVGVCDARVWRDVARLYDIR